MLFFTQAAAALALFNGLATSSPLASRAAAAAGPQSTLQQITDLYPDQSGKAKMYVYVPPQLAPKPAIIVALHFCTGTAEAYFTGSPYAQLADEKGFVVIYPESPHEGTCWDVSSRETLSHGGSSSDSASIASMVGYALKKYGGDASKVFVTGSSSGAMMTVSHPPFDYPKHPSNVSFANHCRLTTRMSWRPHTPNSSKPPSSTPAWPPAASSPPPGW